MPASHVIGARPAQSATTFIQREYNRVEYHIPMRDGVRLFAVAYIPKDISAKKKYPILLNRTCYNAGKYMNPSLRVIGPSEQLMKDKYIIVYEDVRGRYRSEGVFNNMPPFIVNKKTSKDVDESSDAYDTIDWLVKNIKNNNGRVGTWGISYPGYYAAASAMCGHPALRACSPQAPIGDLFFDDFHHNGAFVQAYLLTFPVFGVQKTRIETQNWFKHVVPNTKDGFAFYKQFPTLQAYGNQYLPGNFFWQDVIDHPNYDEYWSTRAIVPHFNQNVHTAVMVVGGWLDAEDLYGPLHIYQSIEKKNPNIYNTLVMTPFGHGRWSRETGAAIHNDIHFGDSVATFYQRHIEGVFFTHFLKGKGDGKTGLPEAYMYNTGAKRWETFAKWPSAQAEKKRMYLSAGGHLTWTKDASVGSISFVSDPDKPVPHSALIKEMLRFTPYGYMSEDQRFAAKRPDVLVFSTPTLTKDVTIGGQLRAYLQVATTGTDADFIVKVIDVHPDDEADPPHWNNPHSPAAGYQQLIRADVMRGRFRHSFSKPQAFVPGQKTLVEVPLQDILHTFKKGHKIMVQVQSTWFPLIDRNPQSFVPNIYKAKASDFIRTIHTIYNDSYLECDVIESTPISQHQNPPPKKKM